MFFLSYAGADAAVAGALAKGLKAAGIDVWFDKGYQAVEPGKPVLEQLERKLQESQGFLLLVPRHGVDRWVRAEVDVALHRQVNEPAYRIIPLRSSGVDVRQLPPFIARFHALTLEGDVTQWEHRHFQGLAEQLGTASTRFVLAPGESPFLGLESFKEEHARFYFGRDREIREALARLGRGEGTYRRWLAVEGASGAGKSSFARAGLVPSIRGGWVEGAPSQWRIAVMRPGKRPVHQLARALVRTFDWQDIPGKLTQVEAVLRSPRGLHDTISAKLTEAEGFLLVVDQLEEVFTLTEGARDEPRHLDTLLSEALTSGELPFFLITTLRSDFLIRMGELPHLEEALNAGWTSRYNLSLMKPQQLHEALLGPSQLAGLFWEGGLQERILQEAEVLSGGLPLVAHVLRELWKRRSGQLLTHAAYEQLGRVAGALSLSADALLDTFTPDEKAHVRKLMLALVKVGPGTRDARRARTIEEAVTAAGGGETGHGILVRLSGGRAPQMPAEAPAPPRLLAVGTEHVDLVHEALLEQWRTLRDWLAESRDALELQNDLDASARLWKATGALPSEAQLQYLKSAEPVSTESRELLDQVRRADLAQSMFKRISEKAVQDDPQFCLRLIIEAHGLHPSGKTTDALWSWYQRRQRLCLRGHSGPVTAVAFSANGQRALTLGEDGSARLWDAKTGKFLAELRGQFNFATVAAFSPDGQRIVTAGVDRIGRLWDAKTGQALAELRGHAGPVTAVEFSPRGQRVLIASEDGTCQLWHVATGKALAELLGHSGPVKAVVFSPDSQRILTASEDGTGRLWDVKTGMVLFELRGHLGPVTAAAFSPDGQRVLTGSKDKAAWLWDATTGKVLLELRGHLGPVTVAAFSPDGQRVLTIGGGWTAWLWDAATGKSLAELSGHSGPVKAAMFSPDGRRILTASVDRTARLWDATTSETLVELRGHKGPVKAATFSPDGQRILTSSQDAAARLWDATTGTTLAELNGPPGVVKAVAFSADGQRILTVGEEGSGWLWDVASGKALAELRGHSGPVKAAAFSPDGQRIFTVGEDGLTRWWDATTGKAMAELSGHLGRVTAAAISPDGQRILTVGEGWTARLWDAITGKALVMLRGQFGSVKAAAFSPDGQRVLTTSEEEIARLWNATTGKVLAELRGHSGLVTAGTFSPDGQRVLTGSKDWTARLWDATTGKVLVTLRGHSGPVTAVAISPDGQHVLTASEDQTARLWRVHDVCPPTEELFKSARAVLFREFTAEEREFYLGEAPP